MLHAQFSVLTFIYSLIFWLSFAGRPTVSKNTLLFTLFAREKIVFLIWFIVVKFRTLNELDGVPFILIIASF